MQFEWDDKKSEANFKKHGVRFEEAQTVFLDINSLEFLDESHSYQEDRFIRIGASGKLRILLVIFCERAENTIRIISARKASTKEKKIYEEGL